MSTPLEFLKVFSARLRRAGVHHVITSGMACVFYGLQQTTKDSDLVIDAKDLPRFLDLLGDLEHEMPPWRVSYRVIFGAPLEPGYMAHGWTSHLSLWDRADSPEHHVDIFSKPPRVARVETGPESDAFASRHMVAQMKRTDRERDWPIVDGLGLQLRRLAPEQALLHIMDARLLREFWEQAPPAARDAASQRRPLLRLLPSNLDSDALHARLRLERIVWETVNQERYRLYEAAWKQFYRSWRADESFEWPTPEPCRKQHERLCQAAARFGLPRDPIGQVGRQVLYDRALRRAVVRADSTAEKVAEVQPPLAEILP
ncbi:MAG: hypothetical protein HY721_21720 [Planctomycetes bacterium]|nr:hypothetical protein [Planctomycetota bacterium]